MHADIHTRACVCVCVQMTMIPYLAAETVMETVKGHKDSMSAVMDFASKWGSKLILYTCKLSIIYTLCILM